MPQSVKYFVMTWLLVILCVIELAKCSPTIIMNYNSTFNITMYENNQDSPRFFIPKGFNCYNYDLFTNNLTGT